MFGFQRIGDLAWAAGDMMVKGFMVGGTAGRTTLNGEGLQHQDGHSHVLASTIPNIKSYDRKNLIKSKDKEEKPSNLCLRYSCYY